MAGLQMRGESVDVYLHLEESAVHGHSRLRATCALCGRRIVDLPLGHHRERTIQTVRIRAGTPLKQCLAARIGATNNREDDGRATGL